MKLRLPSLSTFNRRPFWISLIGGFLMAFFQNTSVVHFDFFDSIPTSITSASTTFETIITPKLQKIQNSFSLHSQSSSVPLAYASGDYDQASAYAVVDLNSGDILAQKNEKDTYAIASLTKIMTAIVALDLADPKEEFVVSERASTMIPTKIGVRVGQQLTLSELLEAAMLTSANDAVQVIAEGINKKYGEDVFVDAMNKKAEILGLQDTHFANPQGFDDVKNYSTVHDLAILTEYALRNYPDIATITQKDYTFLPANDKHTQFDLYNWNGLVGVYPNVKGVKIGSTGKAGKTTIVVAQRGNERIAVILLGAPGILERDLWAAALLDVGFQKVANLPPVNVTELALREKYATWKYFN